MESHRLGFGTILVATDLSGSLTSAVRYAQALAARHGSKLVLADVIDPVRYAFECGEEEFYGVERGRPRELQRILSDIRLRGVMANAIPGRRSICQRVLELVEEHVADVLVVGTRVNDATSRMALGRVARELAGRAGTSLITVPGGGEAFVASAEMPRRVVAATDLKPASLAALRLAQPFFHENLTVLHAGQWHSGHDCLNRLDHLRTEAPAGHWRATHVDHCVLQGEPGLAIAEFARKQNADLVVLGSPEGPARDEKSVCSTVTQVIAQVSCPVMCVRRVEEELVEQPLPAYGVGGYASAHRHVA
jgi:nucleotide-binding universal stress UspA family protein